MNEAALSELLSQVAAGQLDVATAMSRLTKLPFADLGFARVDHHRSLRAGFPEVVFCQGKRPEHVLAIFKELLSHGSAAFGTRATKEHADVVTAALPDCRYDPSSRLLFSRVQRPLSRAQVRCSSSALERPIFPSQTKQPSPQSSSAVTSSACATSVSLAFIAYSPQKTSYAPHASSSLSLAWKVRSHLPSLDCQAVPSLQCPRPSDTVQAFPAWPRCSECSRRARPVSPSSTSTMALGPVTPPR